MQLGVALLVGMASTLILVVLIAALEGSLGG